jgi:hypothetical protein
VAAAALRLWSLPVADAALLLLLVLLQLEIAAHLHCLPDLS